MALMTGLRQKKKEAVRQHILDAAAHIFRSRGYAQATVADIALRANAGVGTCYNYFPSKAHLFCESMLFSRKDLLEQFDRLSAEGEADPGEVVMSMVDMVLDVIAPVDKQFLQEILQNLATMYLRPDNSSNMIFQRVFKQRRAIVKICQERGLLPQKLDAEETVVCLFSILLLQMVAYALDETMTPAQLRQSIYSKVKLFFMGKEHLGGVLLREGNMG
jgi:AcrR family transcriptional regulator